MSHFPPWFLPPHRLQGAAFSGGTLHQQSPNDPEVAGVPDVTLAYVHKDEPRPYQVICVGTNWCKAYSRRTLATARTRDT